MLPGAERVRERMSVYGMFSDTFSMEASVMNGKLKKIDERCRFLEYALALPESVLDSARYGELMREYHAILPIADKIQQYRKLQSSAEEARAILESEHDPELRALAAEEARAVQEQLTPMEREIRLMLLPRDPNDDKNVIVEIRAGAGGEEAALFAGVLYRMYVMYAESHGFRCEPASENETELGGFREITFLVSGSGAYSRFKYESGVHRVQRVPETESSGRIHTSTATVAVLPEADEVQIHIDPADLLIDTIKSTGAGGQHINKTESAIRLTHKPSGIVIECQDERSQLRNKEKAMRLLRAKLFEMRQTEQNERIAAQRRSQVGTGDRSERIRTYNYPQGRITDHRIGLTLYSLNAFLDGELDTVVDALAAAEATEKIQESGSVEEHED